MHDSLSYHHTLTKSIEKPNLSIAGIYTWEKTITLFYQQKKKTITLYHFGQKYKEMS